MSGESLEILYGGILEPRNFLLVSERSTGLEEQSNVLAVDLASLNHDLETHHHLKSHLVRFEETSVDVSVNLVGKRLDDVFHALFDSLRLVSLVDTIVEEIEELVQRSVVHPVYQRHLDDAEIEHGTSSRDWAVLFTLLINFDSLDLCRLQLVSHFLGFQFDLSEHINQRGVVEQGSLSSSQFVKELLLTEEKLFLVERY